MGLDIVDDMTPMCCWCSSFQTLYGMPLMPAALPDLEDIRASRMCSSRSASVMRSLGVAIFCSSGTSARESSLAAVTSFLSCCSSVCCILSCPWDIESMDDVPWGFLAVHPRPIFAYCFPLGGPLRLGIYISFSLVFSDVSMSGALAILCVFLLRP